MARKRKVAFNGKAIVMALLLMLIIIELVALGVVMVFASSPHF
jgi:hypothetical protein